MIVALYAYKHKILQESCDGFDIRDMMNALGTFELGVASIDEIHLSCLNASSSRMLMVVGITGANASSNSADVWHIIHAILLLVIGSSLNFALNLN